MWGNCKTISTMWKEPISTMWKSLYQQCGKEPISTMWKRADLDNVERAYIGSVEKSICSLHRTVFLLHARAWGHRWRQSLRSTRAAQIQRARGPWRGTPRRAAVPLGAATHRSGRHPHLRPKGEGRSNVHPRCGVPGAMPPPIRALEHRDKVLNFVGGLRKVFSSLRARLQTFAP